MRPFSLPSFSLHAPHMTALSNKKCHGGFKVRMGPGPTFPVEKEIPVISPVLTVRAVQIGAPPWQSMRPMEKQEVRQVCSDRHETCTLIFQLFEIYNLAY